MNQIQLMINLRGGGCGISKINALEPSLEKTKFNSELPSGLLSLTQTKVKNLQAKMLMLADKSILEEYLNTINWLGVNEYWYQRIPNDKLKMTNCIKLLQFILLDILEIVESIINGSRFIAYSLMRVANNFSRILVVYYTQNEGTYLDLDLSNRLKEKINSIKEIIKKNSETALYYNALQYESNITDACINICPVDDPQGKELGFKALAEIVKSAASLSPSKDLFSSLGDLAFFGVKALYQKYKESNFKEMMTKCLFIEQYKWTIVTCIEKEKFSIKEIFNTLTNFYEKDILCSKSWEIKYCWIKVMHWIMGYRIVITQEIFNQQDIERIDQFWYQLIQEQVIQIIERSDYSMGAVVNEDVIQTLDLTSNPIYLEIVRNLRTINRIKSTIFNGSAILPQLLTYDQVCSNSKHEENETNMKISHVQDQLQCFQIPNIMDKLQQVLTLITNVMINMNDLREPFNDSVIDQHIISDICQQAKLISRQIQEVKQIIISLSIRFIYLRCVVDNWFKLIFSDDQLQQLHKKLESQINLKSSIIEICTVLRQYHVQKQNNEEQNLHRLQSYTEYLSKKVELIKFNKISDVEIKNKIIEKMIQISKAMVQNSLKSNYIDELEQLNQFMEVDNQKAYQFNHIIEVGIHLLISKTALDNIELHLNFLEQINIISTTLSYIPFNHIKDKILKSNQVIQCSGLFSLDLQFNQFIVRFKSINQSFQNILTNKLCLNKLYDMISRGHAILPPTSLQHKQLLEEVISFQWMILELSIITPSNVKLELNQSFEHMDGILDLQQQIIQHRNIAIEDFSQFISTIQSIDKVQNKKNIQSRDILTNLKSMLEQTKIKMIELPIRKFYILFDNLLKQDQKYQIQFSRLNNQLNMQEWKIINLNEDLFRQIQLPQIQQIQQQALDDAGDEQISKQIQNIILNMLKLINSNINMQDIIEIQELISTQFLNEIDNCNLSDQNIQRIMQKLSLYNNIDSGDLIQIDILSSEIIQLLKSINHELSQQQQEIPIRHIQDQTVQSAQLMQLYFKDNSLQHKQYQSLTKSLKQIIKFNSDNSNQEQFIQSKKQQLENMINLINNNFDEILSFNLTYSENHNNQVMSCTNVQKLIEILKIPSDINESQMKSFFGSNQTSIIALESIKSLDEDRWRYRECQIFSVITTQQRLISQYQIEYGKQLVIYKAIETDIRIQKVFRSTDFILQQQNALEKYWKQQSSTIQSLISSQLFKLQQLQKQISSQQPGPDRDNLLLDHRTLENQIDEQIENVSSIGSSLGITIAFIKDLKKELIMIQDQLKELNTKINDISMDIKFLMGKSPQQLLEIHMEKVLKQKMIDDARQVFVQLYAKEITNFDKRIESELEIPIINEEQKGCLDEFLRASRLRALLIHGQAGSGKSTVAKKVEEYLWTKYKQQKISTWRDAKEPPIVPIFIQLPSLKDPKFKALQETLKSLNYLFNDKQINELQQNVLDRTIRLFIIMDSYDELNRYYIEQNLNITNKFDQWCNGSNYQILNTTRSEIFTTKIEYRSWFSATNSKVSKENFKEIRILPFNDKQRDNFYDQYQKLSLKQTIIDIYDVLFDQKHTNQDTALIINDVWEQISKILSNSFRSERLLDTTQVNQIIQLMNSSQHYKIDLYKDQEAHLRQKLNSLWSSNMYKNSIKQLGIIHLIETPYMTNIVVSVLPQLIEQYSTEDHLKLVFLRNIEEKLASNRFKLGELNPNQIWDILIQSKALNEYKITDTEISQRIISHLGQEVSKKLQNLMQENNQEVQLQNTLQAFINLESGQEFDQDILIDLLNNEQLDDPTLQQLLQALLINQEIVESIQQNQPTSYDFYELFLSEFINKQIVKLSYKQMNFQTSKHFQSSLVYIQNLGTLMTINQVTQIEYQQQGILQRQTKDLFQDEIYELFDDNAQNSSIKAQIRTSLPLKTRGDTYSFFHKSIQEYLFAKSFLDLLECIKQLESLKIVELYEHRRLQQYANWDYTQTQSYEGFRKMHKMKIEQVQSLIKFLQYLSQHFINQKIYQDEFYIGSIKFIINKIRQDQGLVRRIMILVKISKLGIQFSNCSSNCFHIMNSAQIALIEQDLSGIHLLNISISNCNLSRADLSFSKFKKVDINGLNLVNANLSHCNWYKLMTNELPVLKLKSQVLCVSYSPNNLNIASGTEDGALQIWDALSGKLISESSNGQICSLTYFPDGKFIASGGKDLIISDAQSAKKIGESLSGHTRKIRALVFSPDGNFIASGSEDNTIRIWDIKARKQIGDVLIGHTAYVLSLSYSPDGKYIASGSADSTIRIWKVQSQKQIGDTINGNNGYVWSIKYSPDGQFIASGDDSTIRILDARSGRQVGENLDGTDYVRSITYSPDGRFIASDSGDNIKIWDVRLGRQIGESLTGHSGTVRSVQYSYDGKFIVSGSEDNTIRIWDARPLKSFTERVAGHTGPILSVVYSPDGNSIASASRDKSMIIWNAKTGVQIRGFNSHADEVRCVDYSPDGKFIATGSADCIKIYDIRSGKQVGQIINNGSILSMKYSLNCQFLIVSGSDDNTIKIFDTRSLEIKTNLIGHTGTVFSVAVSQDNNFIASGSGDHTVRIWDIQSGQQTGELNGHTDNVTSVSYSPDGQFIASGSGDKTIRIWSADSRLQIGELNGHTGYVWSVSYSPDGMFIASGSGDKTVRVWNVQSRKQVGQTLIGHTGEVNSVIFSSDGKFIVSGSADQTIRIWQTQSDEKIQHNDELKQNYCLLRIPNRGPIMYHGCKVIDTSIQSSLGINVLQLWKDRQNQKE